MKLNNIYENIIGQKLRDISRDTKLFRRPELHKIPLYDAEQANDSGARATGNTSYPTGIPTKKRHRKYFNMSVGPEEVNL